MRPAGNSGSAAAWIAERAEISATVSARASATATAFAASSVSTASSQAEEAFSSSRRLRCVSKPVEVARAARMPRIDGQHQAVEEAAALAGRAGEKPVHRRRQPQHAEIFEHRLGGAAAGAVDADAAVLRLAGRVPPAMPVPRRAVSPSQKTSAATAQPSFVPVRVISAKGARRSPRPGVNSEIASRMLVLPAPFGPVSTTSGAANSRAERGVAAEILQRQRGERHAGGGHRPTGDAMRQTRIGIST